MRQQASDFSRPGNRARPPRPASPAAWRRQPHCRAHGGWWWCWWWWYSPALAILCGAFAPPRAAVAQPPRPDGPLCRLQAAGDAPSAESILGLAFSPDGQQLATRSSDDRLRIWSLPQGKLQHLLAGHEKGPVCDLAFSHDGSRLLSLSPQSGEGLVIWNVADGTALERIDQPGRLLHRSPQPNVFSLVTPTYVMRFSLDNPRHLVPRYLVHNRPEVEPAAISPDEQHVLLYVKRAQVDLAGHLLLVHQVGTASESLLFPFEKPVIKAVFAPQGNRIAVICRGDGRLHFRDKTRPQFQLALESQPGALHDVAFAPDGRWLVTVAQDGRLRLLETLTMQAALQWESRGDRLRAAAFSDDGQLLAAGGAALQGPCAIVWDIRQLIRSLVTAAEEHQPPQSDLWQQLGDPDPSVGYVAVGRMLRDAEQGLAAVTERLRQDNDLSGLRDLPQLITELDHASFATRQAAFQKLLPLRQQARPQLEDALRQAPNVERRIQLQRLLDDDVAAALRSDQDRLRYLRTLHALELLGGPRAAALVEEIARVVPDKEVVEQARTLLKRMEGTERL